MRLLKNRSLHFYLGLVLLLAMVLGGSAIAAFADSGGASVTLNAGTLSETGTFGESASVSLTGSDQNVNYTLPVQVTDATGSGAGWNLTISATALTDTHSHTLSQEVFSTATACATGSTCTLPTSTSHPVTLPLTLGTTAAKFFSADANTGLGVIVVTTMVRVDVPGNAYAGTYNTTLTLASVSGPIVSSFTS